MISPGTINRFAPIFKESFSMFKNITATILATLIAISITTGCVYRVDVQQGNEINQSLIDQVSEGMTKREVIRLLGFPLINDPFNRDRWDYFYSLKDGKTQKVSQQSATLIFSEDELQSIETNLTE